MTGQAATRPGGADGRPNQVSGGTPSAVVNSIGPKIRQLRKQWSLSLQQFADRSDVSTAAIHKVEQGAMAPTTSTAGATPPGTRPARCGPR